MLKQRPAGDKSWPIKCRGATLSGVDKDLVLSGVQREEKGAEEHAVLAARGGIAGQRRDSRPRVQVAHLYGEHGHPPRAVHNATIGVVAFLRVQLGLKRRVDLARVDRAAHVQGVAANQDWYTESG